MNRSAREGKSVKRFERSNGPDIALYKNYLFFYISRGVPGNAPEWESCIEGPKRDEKPTLKSVIIRPTTPLKTKLMPIILDFLKKYPFLVKKLDNI